MKAVFSKVLAWAAERGSDVVRDGVGLAGAGLVAFGAHEIYRPAGFIVGGVLLIVGAFLTAKGSA